MQPSTQLLGAGSRAHVLYTDDLGTDRATADTVAIMRQLALQASASPIVHSAVAEALAGLPEWASDKEKTQAIYNWVRHHVRFNEDEYILADATGELVWNRELLITPERLLTVEQPTGDCDDFSTLLAGMLLAVDIPVSFVTIAANPDTPDRFSHVYVKATLPRGEDVYLDASHGTYLGWESPEMFRKIEWPI